MNASDLNLSPLILRLESEIQTLKAETKLQRGIINLARERAEDAEADLDEVRKELAIQTARANELQAKIDREQAEIDKSHEQEYQDHLADLADEEAKLRNGEYRKAEEQAVLRLA